MKSENSVLTQVTIQSDQNRLALELEKRESKLPRAERNAVVSIYDSHASAEAAVEKLTKANFDIATLTVISREYLDGYRAAGERMRFWTWRGILWGGVAGLLVSIGFLWVPGIRPLLVGGPLLNVILCVIQGSVFGGGLSALIAGLIPRVTLFVLGIPSASLLKYEAKITAGKCLLVVRGTEKEAARAREMVRAGTLDTEFTMNTGKEASL